MEIHVLNKKVQDFTDIYNEYYGLIYSTIYNKINNVDETEDICQELFLRFYNKYEEIENPRKWLLGAIRFVVIEYYRKKNKSEVNIDELFDDINLTFVNGFRDTRIIIEQALEDMNNFENEAERILFDLIAVCNFSYKEAGQEIGLTEHQARYRYSQIVNRLVQYFNKKGINSLEDLL